MQTRSFTPTVTIFSGRSFVSLLVLRESARSATSLWTRWGFAVYLNDIRIALTQGRKYRYDGRRLTTYSAHRSPHISIQPYLQLEPPAYASELCLSSFLKEMTKAAILIRVLIITNTVTIRIKWLLWSVYLMFRILSHTHTFLLQPAGDTGMERTKWSLRDIVTWSMIIVLHSIGYITRTKLTSVVIRSSFVNF